MAALCVLMQRPGRCLVASCCCLRVLSTDLVAALRPFYLAIKPDHRLAERTPAEEQRVNEKSLRQLSAHLESLTGQSGGSSSSLPVDGQLEFYVYSVPDGAASGGGGGKVVSRLVKVQIDRSLLDPRAVIRSILRSCKLLPKEEEEQVKQVSEQG